MNILDIIENKKNRKELTKEEIEYFVKKYTEEKVGKFTGAEVVAHCPSIGRSSVLASLRKLVDEGSIIRYGSGRSTYYVKADRPWNAKAYYYEYTIDW